MPRRRRPEERAKRGDALIGPRAALGDPNASRLEVLLPLPAHADPEQQAPTREIVERSHLLGHEARVPQRQQHNTCAEPDPARPGGECGECDAEIENRVVEGEVLARPQRVEAGFLG